MFSEIMLILQFLRSRFVCRIEPFAARRHLRHFFQHYRVVYSLIRVFSPCKRSVIFTKHCRNCNIIFFARLKLIGDQYTGIQFIRFLDLFFCQISYTRNLTVNIICVGCSIAWNVSSALCPARRPLGMSMHDTADLRETVVKHHMGRRIGRRIISSLSTLLPLRSTTTISSGVSLSYSTPLGLMTNSPDSRSIPLTFPHVNVTSPCFGSSIFASYTSFFNCSSIAIISFSYCFYFLFVCFVRLQFCFADHIIFQVTSYPRRHVRSQDRLYTAA